MASRFAPEHHISKRYGFLAPPEDLATQLPAAFAAWEALAANLPGLIRDGTLADRVGALETLDHAPLLASRPLTLRGHAVLSVVAQAYVWRRGERDPARRIPACLAVPWCALSEVLGVPPVLTHCVTVLHNCRLRDPGRPFGLDNADLALSITGTDTERWFFLVTQAIEVAGGPALCAIDDASRGAAEEDPPALEAGLQQLAAAIGAMTAALGRMREHCDPQVFYHQVRPFLSGWRGSDVLPEGMVYEGVWDVPREYSGGSAGQSSLVAAIDIALGVTHGPVGNSGEVFLRRMRDYMPAYHREALARLEEGLPEGAPFETVRDAARGSGPAVLAAYNSCVAALHAFRTAHIAIVTQFVIIPARKAKASKGLAVTGTGGSDLIPFLKHVRQEANIPINATETTVEPGDRGARSRPASPEELDPL